MSRRHFIRKVVASTLVTSMASFGLQAVSAPARATTPMPQDIQALLHGIGQYAAFSHALGNQGALGQPMPLVDLSPGGPDGLAFAPSGSETGLLDGAVANTLTDEANSANTNNGTVVLSDLASDNQAVTFSDGSGRTGTLTVVPSGTSGSTEQLDITLTVTRTVNHQGLRISGQAGGQPVDLTSANGVRVVLTADVHFSAVVVPNGSSYYFYIVHDSSGPSLGVNAEASIPDPHAVDGAIGILGVTMSAASFDARENLSVTTDDPNNDGQLAFTNADGTTGELAQPGAASGLMHVNFADPAGSVTDTAADQGTSTPPPASFTVETADTNVVPNLPAIQTTITASWPDVSTGAPVLGADSGLATANDFLTLTPKDLSDGLAHLANTITAIQQAQWTSGSKLAGNIDLPYMKGTLADALDASAALGGFIAQVTYNPANPLAGNASSDPAKNGQPTFASLQELVADLEAFANDPPAAPAIPNSPPPPTFQSLPGKATITVGSIDFNNATSGPDKLLIPLTFTTPSGGAVNLDVKPILASGGPNTDYGTDTLTDHSAGVTFPSSLAGQRLQVGSGSGAVTGIVDHVSGNVLTLKAQTQIAPDAYWVKDGAQVGAPASDTAYQVLGSDPQTGQLQFGDTFSDVGITKANADSSSATVKPSDILNVGLVLDLQPPITGGACDTGGAATEFPQYSELPAPCPFQHTNADGSTTTITQLPTNTDRIQLRTTGGGHLLTADFPITSTAPSNLSAKVGYLDVHLSGKLQLTEPANGHMLTIDLKPQTTPDGSGDLTLDQVTRDVVAGQGSDASSLLDESLHAGTSVSLSVDVPDSSSSSTLPSGPSFFGDATLPTISIDWGDIGAGAAPPPTFGSGLSDLTKFAYDANNSAALVAPLTKSLQVLDTSLGSLATASSVLGTRVPVVGRSVGALLSSQDSGGGSGVSYGTDSLTDTGRSFDSTNDPKLVGLTMTVGTAAMTIAAVAGAGGGTEFTFTQPFSTQPADGTPYVLTSPLADLAASLGAQPPASLQDYLKSLTGKLGSDAGGHPSTATIGFDPANNAVVIYLDWRHTSHTVSTLTLADCSTQPCPSATLIGGQDMAPVPIAVTTNDDVGFEVPLQPGAGPADSSALTVTSSSTVGGGLSVSYDGNGAPAATIGQLDVTLGHAADQIQLRGHYDVTIGGGGSGTQALASFVAQTPNVTAPGVACPAGSFTGQALCAVIPVYDQPNGSVGPIDVHIPTSASDLLSTSGHLDPGTTTLATDIANANKTIGFAGLADDLNHYFDLAQQSLNGASFNGRLPLVGHDLQAGSDFIGTLKSDFDSAVNTFTGHVGSTAGELQTNLGTDLTNALPNANIVVQVACKAPLAPVKGFAVQTTPNPPPTTGTASWEYEVVAYHKNGSTETLTTPAGPLTVVNKNPLDSTDYNTLSWNVDDGADGYLVLRSEIDGSGNPTGVYDQLADIASSSLSPTDTTVSFKDDGSVTPSTFTGTIPANPPNIDYAHCPISTDISFVTTVTATVKAGDTVSATVPLDIGIPGLSISPTASTGGLTASASWNLDVTFGIDRSSGFFIKSGSDVLNVQAEVQSPKDFQAQIAFLTMAMHDNNADSPSQSCGTDTGLGSLACITASIGVSKDLTAADLANPGELTSSVSASVTGHVNIDWGFKIDPNVPVAQQLLPGITGNFVLDWGPMGLSTTAGVMSADNLTIAFDNVAIDAGEFLTGVLGPIINEVKAVTDPLQPVIDQLTAPIPVLSDLSHLAGGGDVTLLSIAEAFNTLANGPDLSMINTLVSITKLFKKVSSITCSSDCSILIGSYTITSGSSGGAQSLLDNASTPDGGPSLTSLGTLPASAPNVGSELNSKSSDTSTAGLFDASGSDTSVTLNNNCAPSSASGTSETEKAGVTFPVISHPFSIFGLLLGRDISLACFDSGYLSIGFSYSQAFGPVYAPPPVLLTISGSASASLHIVGGFDTYGMRTAVQNIANGTFNSSTPLQFLDSLFLTTTDAHGNPIPVVTLSGKLSAGAEVSAVIISVGVQGGISLTINFTWHDPDNDGKFRFDEFLVTALSNPLCLFNVSGQLGVFLELDITIGFSIFSYTFSITLANIKLLDFSIQPDCTPPPPTLGAVDGGSNTLIVYAGQLGNGSSNLRGDPAWDNHGTADETFKITQYHHPDGSVSGYAIDALGVHDTFPPTVTSVYVDGQNYNGNMTVIMQGALDPADVPSTQRAQDATGQTQSPQHLPFTADAIVYGGNGDDTITTGQGSSYIDGGGGNDHITTADVSNSSGRAYVTGGGNPAGGGDQIRVGNADDEVAGDSGLIAPASKSWKGVSIPDWTTPPSFPPDSYLVTSGSADGNDHILVGLGKSTVWGNGGDDTISVSPNPTATGAGSPQSQGVTIIGGDGSDVISGGNGNDVIYTGTDETKTTDNGSPTDYGASDSCTNADVSTPQCPGGVPRNVVDTGGGVDPSTGQPLGGGNDTVYGSVGVDLVSGHSAPDQTDTIFGGGANDVLTGGYGTDKIYGGPGDDYVIAEPSKVSEAASYDDVIGGIDYGPHRDVTHQPLPSQVSPSAKLLVGGTGNDHIVGGNGGATIFGDSSTESSCPTTSPPPAGATPPSETGQTQPPDGNDLITGGSGQDIVQAGGGDDYVDSGSGNDFVCGGSGNDTLIGQSLANQTDTFYGGSDNDVLISGSGNDWLFGNGNTDVLYGRNGNDTLEGNDGTDTLFGGNGDDLLIGGTTAAAQPDQGDVISGGLGNDRIVGDNGAQVVGGTPDSSMPADMSEPGVIPGDSLVAYDLADGNGASSHGGNDSIYGGNGNDLAYGGVGNDFMSGGNGDDHLEGDGGSDTINGDAGLDDIIGGSAQVVSGSAVAGTAVGYPDTGDILRGGAGSDVLLGDNGAIYRAGQTGFDSSNTYLTDNRSPTARTVLRFDLGDTPAADTSGNDFIAGDAGNDVLLGQGGDDRLLGGFGNDVAEGGPGEDWLQGDAGNDDLIGGSSVAESGSGNTAVGQLDTGDVLLGGAGDDTVAGDNARIVDLSSTQPVPRVFQRLGSDGTPMRPRKVTLLDLNNTGSAAQPDFLSAPAANRYGNDQVDGGAGNDVIYGQDGNDQITGGTGDDYIEGNGGADLIKGDRTLDDPTDGNGVAWMQAPAWAGSPAGLVVTGYTPPANPDSVAGTDGTDCTAPATTQCQDDLIGGSSTQAFRDGGDTIEGDYGDDFMLGDNGTLVRDVVHLPNNAGYAEAVLSQRHPATTILRHHDDTIPGLTSTRFCTTAQATCEPAGAFGNDVMLGDSGNDNMWGQDGNDTMNGGSGNDDMYGELGNDVMEGGPGDDVMLGDRGGAVDVYYPDNSHAFTASLTSPPRETYTGLAAGTYQRQVDLLHDVDGANFVGSSSSPPMPHAGMTQGGNDIMMGGPGTDAMHGGAGNDVMDGDAGGDIVFGDDGADVLYGGQGCDPNASAAKQDLSDACPIVNSQPDLSARGPNDRWVDYEFGGKGGTDPVSLAGDLGSDLLDFAPRGDASTCTPAAWPVTDSSGVTHDPCEWFIITQRTLADPLVHQDHQGTDWMYGGWDRDVMQADVAANGPNPGDRMLDWTGAYNLYTHCNAAYGGYNDVRQFSPGMQTFLQQWAWGSGAGQSASDVTTPGTSAYDELALVYPGDIYSHGAGSAYPNTPGHFDSPTACTP